MIPTPLSIGQVAARTGLSVEALRYYESAGLVPGTVARNSRGQRVYDGSDVTWFEICSSLRRSGMSIATLREYVALVEQGSGTELARLELLEKHQRHLDQQLTDLQAARDLVDYKIEVYRHSLDDGTAQDLWVRRDD